ncbi:MAG: pirin family protein, partial [Bacteroidota bacterium]
MEFKTIKKVIKAQKVNMDGHLLDQPLPAQGVNYIDPFLLIHHWHQTAPGGFKPQEVGVPPHPHRGFSPVTFIYKGDVQHRDSLGNNEIVGAGGTQWMHAGKGITHSERPSKQFAEQGGETEFIQFWVNTPAQYKMETPYYLPLSDEATPKIRKNNTEIAVIAGNFESVQGPAKTYSPQTLLRIETQRGSDLALPIPPTYNTLLYLLDGALQINNQLIKAKELVWFNTDGNSLAISAIEDTRFILLSGEPLNEPIKTYGPFVMNSQTEIMTALKDAQQGKMGILI